MALFERNSFDGFFQKNSFDLISHILFLAFFLKLKVLANLKEFKGKIINNILFKNADKSASNSATYKFPKITHNELETLTNGIKNTLRRFKKVNVELPSDRLILVNKKNNNEKN